MSSNSERIVGAKLVSIAELCAEFKREIEEKSEDCFICAWNDQKEEVKICDEHHNIIQKIEDKAAEEYSKNKLAQEKKRKLKRRIDFNEQHSEKEN
jgi:hypothetical protein